VTNSQEKKENDSQETQKTSFEFPFCKMDEISKMMAGCCGSEKDMTSCGEQMREKCCPQSGKEKKQ
jgi:hypothetical protein